MQNKSHISNNEIDLTELFKTIWDGKVKVFLITLVIVSITMGFTYKRSNLFELELTVRASQKQEFVHFTIMNHFFKLDPKKTPQLDVNRNSMFARFLENLMTYDALISTLKKNKAIKEEISQMSITEQEQVLYNYAQNLTISDAKSGEVGDKETFFIDLQFIWHDINEGKEILDQTFKLVSINMRQSIFTELDNLVKIKKKIEDNIDREEIEYLNKQWSIANDLGITDYVDSFIIPSSPYYLRGSKAIKNEIKIIEESKFIKYENIKNEFILLKKRNFDFVDLNILSLTTTPLKLSIKLILGLSILAGLAIGIFYVIILNLNQSIKAKKKKLTN